MHIICVELVLWYFDSLWILKTTACPIIMNLPLGDEVHLAGFIQLVNRNSTASFMTAIYVRAQCNSQTFHKYILHT